MPIAIGSIAPDFTLKTKTSDGLVDVRLSDNFGKRPVLLFFVPAAFTNVCTKELCDVSTGIGGFSTSNAALYGISADTPYALAAWARDDAITIPLLSDRKLEATRAYDVVWPDFASGGPVPARAVILIDKEGIVRYVEQTPTLNDMPNFEAAQAALDALG